MFEIDIAFQTIKWHFTAPREELVTQLQQQLATCIGSTLMGELFHADFQRHLKAISMLQQVRDPEEVPEAVL